MADPRLCSIPDCGKKWRGHEWCAMHLSRWRRHGDPLAGRTAWGEPGALIEQAARADSRSCLPWPFAKNSAGYGMVRRGGRNLLVHRLVCEMAHGAPPTPQHDAAHSCGQGHAGCVARNHLHWATRRENMQEAAEHGTTTRGEKHPIAKLTSGDVKAIRALLAQGHSQVSIGRRFDVSDGCIWHIAHGTTWGWLE